MSTECNKISNLYEPQQPQQPDSEQQSQPDSYFRTIARGPRRTKEAPSADPDPDPDLKMSTRVLPIVTQREDSDVAPKYRMRFAAQLISFLFLIVIGCAYYKYIPGSTEKKFDSGISTMNGSRNRNNMSPKSSFSYDVMDPLVTSRRLQSSNGTEATIPPPTQTDESVTLCSDLSRADPQWLLALYIIGVIYMFLALAIACDEFFVPALEEMSSERRLNLSMDVAGATLMAAGGSAPELFTSLFGTFTESEIGFGTIVGSAVFNVLFVIAMCSLLAKETLSLTWWPLFRDSLYYAIGLVVLSVFVGVTSKEEIFLWESLVLFSMYICYTIIMYFNKDLYRYFTGEELEYPDEEEDEEDDENLERPRQSSQRSMTDSFVVSGDAAAGKQVHFRWQGTFRAGILKLLRDPDSWLDTAGVGIVAKISGDVDHVFRQVDINGDENIDRDELGQLFELLECHLSPHELDEVFKTLDEDGDGDISKEEFSNWYVRSEERILAQVKHVFDNFDVNKSNTIDRTELKMLLEKLEPRVTDEDVDDAIEQMYKSGSRDEITFDEFSEWYKKSLIYERQRKAVEEDMGGVWENLKPPSEGGAVDWIKYLIVLPLVAAMTLTVPDVQRPGMSKWCYFSFFFSVIWIGGFSYFMVNWTEIIGNTIGIPSVIMGLTILAAGTSVPDLLSSVIVARRGNGDMAVSSSIGSNIFDILVGLPIPWILYSLWPTKPTTVSIGSDNIWLSIFILLGMLVFVIVTVHCQEWKLTKTLGGMMFVFYIGFLVQAIALELPFTSCTEA